MGGVKNDAAKRDTTRKFGVKDYKLVQFKLRALLRTQ